MQLNSLFALSILSFTAATEAQRLSDYSYLDRRDYDHALARRKVRSPSFHRHKPTAATHKGGPSGTHKKANAKHSHTSSPSVSSPPGTHPADSPSHPPSSTTGAPAAAAADAPDKPHSITGKAKHFADSFLDKLKAGNMTVPADMAERLIGATCDANTLVPMISHDNEPLQEASDGVTIGCTVKGMIEKLVGKPERRAIAVEPWGLEVRDLEPWGLQVRDPEAWAWAEPDAYAYAYAWAYAEPEPEPEPEWSEDDVLLYARYIYGDEYEW